MTVIEIKNSLHKGIDGINDEHFLKAIFAMITSFQNNEVVGSIGNTKLTQADILNRELEADADIKAGRVYSTDQVKETLGLK